MARLGILQGRNSMKVCLKISIVLAALLVCSIPAMAQRWPTQPIMLVNGFPPGGGADILARLVAGRLSERLGQAVSVDNRTGANGLIAAAAVAAARPDGHTILLYTMSMASTAPVMPGVTLTFDPDKDLAPAVIIAGLDSLLYVSNKTPFRTVRDIVDYARANPDTLTYGSSGVGSSYQLWAAQFTSMAGIRMLHVPFRGGPPAIAEIIAGRVDMMFGNLAEILPHIRSGAVRPIAFTSTPPSPVLPGVPTIAESGLPEFRADNWFGIAAPGRTPQEIVKRLNVEINRIVAMPEVAEQLVGLGYQPRGGSIEMMGETIVRDRAKWKAVIAANNIRAE
jgi:tripartite-type tricarboxylate transporter receptor subunit TctC